MSGSEVLVIGGGPAGATAAGLLAAEGVEVTLFERDRFPRYHIGESIVPACLPILELLGLRETVQRHGFQRKEGTYFRWGGSTWDYRFGSLTGDYLHAWQVERADFDDLLLRNARERGVTVAQRRQVTAVERDQHGRPYAVRWRDLDRGTTGRHECGQLIDASGRAGIMANHYLAGRRFHESFRNVALWSYWRGAGTVPGAPTGATLVSSLERGWVWMIPLRGRHSVGVVLHRDRFRALRERSELSEVYRQLLAEPELVPGLLAGAEQTDRVRLEQDYSYAAERFAGPGYLLAGDAACFLDPLLSTGVHLAMFSGLLAAACLASVGRGELAEAAAARFYEAGYRRTYLRLLVMVAAVYQQHDSAESYFAQAQGLTVGDAEGDGAFGAFLSLVSGIEDLRDLGGQARTDRLVERIGGLYRTVHESPPGAAADTGLDPAQRERLRATADYWQAVMGAHTVDAGQPVAGLCVTTRPRLAVVPAGTGQMTDFDDIGHGRVGDDPGVG